NPRTLHRAQAMRGREHDAAFSITMVDLCHRRVTIHRAFCQRRERSQDSLRLPKRVGKKNAVAAAGRISLPPIENLSSQVRVAMPSITWRTKCSFGHKHITWHGLKWFTGGIRFSFIIAGNDPDFSVPFHAYLGRSQNMGYVANFAQEVVKGQIPLSVEGIRQLGSRTIRPQYGPRLPPRSSAVVS